MWGPEETSTSNTAGQCHWRRRNKLIFKHVQDDSINNEFNSTAESSKDFDAAGGSIFEEDNVDECSHVSEQVCDVVYVFHNVSLHCLFCSIFDTYVAYMQHFVPFLNNFFVFLQLCMYTLLKMEDTNITIFLFQFVTFCLGLKRRNVTTMKVRVNHVI